MSKTLGKHLDKPAGRTVGIDLGTTNSCMAVIQGGLPIVIPNAEGGRTTASVVAFTADGQRLVGASARQQQLSNSQNTIASIKRLMGRQWDEVTGEMAMLAYAVEKSQSGDARVMAAGRQYAPPEISAMILQKLKADAEAYLGETVSSAVITVPAYFNNAQREATKDAGKIAGLQVLRILNEPTAASLAYGLDQAQAPATTILVYDLGGGTFDVSILDLAEGVFEVRATNGDNHLGGDNFDQAVVDWMVAEFKRLQGVDLAADRLALPRLYEAAEKAKVLLSSTLTTQITLAGITSTAVGAQHRELDLDLQLSRDTLNQLTAGLIARTVGPIQQALADAGIEPSAIDHVVLVGGMTRMPAVRDTLMALIGKPPQQGVNPDEVVAVGAAIQAGILAGEVKDILLLDVTPLALGVETKGGVFTQLIARNTSIPTSQLKTFTTAEAHQTTMDIHVLQGESEMATFNKSLGNFQLVGIPPAPRGLMQVDVTFDIDANGIIHVHARDIATDNAQQIRIEAGSGLSADEVSRMIEEAATHAAEAHQLRALADARNLAESLAQQIELSLNAHRNKIAEADAAAIEGRIMALRQAQGGNAAADIRACIEALTAAAQALRVKPTARQPRPSH